MIPSSVTIIEKQAFYNCSSLEQIVIHSSVAKIGIEAFLKCWALKEASIFSPTKIKDDSFPSQTTKIWKQI